MGDDQHFHNATISHNSEMISYYHHKVTFTLKSVYTEMICIVKTISSYYSGMFKAANTA